MRPSSSPVIAVVVAAVIVASPRLAEAGAVCYAHPVPNVNISDPYGAPRDYGSHRGVDYAAPSGTPIGAIADGTIVVKDASGCLGNVVVVQHPDGLFSGYSHMLGQSPLAVGQAVSRGQQIGQVGTTGTCSTGPHLHLTLSPAASGYYSGATIDPFAHINGNLTCSCDRSSGIFSFSCDGPQDGQTCVNVDEPSDPSSWKDNHFCATKDIGLKWSSSGKIDGLDCTAVVETVGPAPDAWKDNYVCVAKQLPYKLSWSMAGPLPGQACVQWNEPAAASWQDNYLCYQNVFAFSAKGFTFKMDGAVPGAHCVKVEEPGDPDSWSDNHFCSDDDLGMKWSYDKPIAGMDCTNVQESADPHAAAWVDNYVCLPKGAPYKLTWSSAGPLAGKSCVRWFDHAEPSATWWDNWMCIDDVDVPPPSSGGSSGASGKGGSGGTTSAGGASASGAGAGSGSTSAGGASTSAGGASTSTGGPSKGGTNAGGGKQLEPVTGGQGGQGGKGTPRGGVTGSALDPETEESASGCGVSSGPAHPRPWLVLVGAFAAALRRRRRS